MKNNFHRHLTYELNLNFINANCKRRPFLHKIKELLQRNSSYCTQRVRPNNGGLKKSYLN